MRSDPLSMIPFHNVMNNNDLLLSYFGTYEMWNRRNKKLHPWNKQSFSSEFMAKCVLNAKIPSLLNENIFSLNTLSNFDKIFACKWIDHYKVLTGTKDNKLILWDVGCKPFKFRIIEKPPSVALLPNDHCGIHSISTNSSRSLLATGSTNPNEIVVYSLPDFSIQMTLIGHDDWVFGTSFLSENIVVSASRDTRIGMWSISNQREMMPIKPVQEKVIKVSKIRDVKSNKFSSEFSTLRSDGTVNIWNENIQEIIEIKLTDKNDVVCMDWEEKQNIICVGSQNRLTMLDPRIGSISQSIPSLDDECGIRSININDFMVSIGGGKGRLSFYDLRNCQYLSLDNGSFYYQISKGSVRCELFHGYPVIEDQPTAIYAHQYDHSGTRLFAAGGPLLASMVGCYASIWK